MPQAQAIAAPFEPFSFNDAFLRPELGTAAIDFETRSPVDLTKTGTGPYCAHTLTDVWCLAFKLPGDADPRLWVKDQPFAILEPLFAHIERGGLISGWNLSFEFAVWAMLRRRRPDVWPALRREQCDDTMVRALALALPGALGACAVALGLEQTKDDKGRRLMLQMAKPRAPRKGEVADKLLWHDDADRLHRLGEYCKQDVRTESAVAEFLRPLSEGQRRTWLLDQTINARGIAVDIDACRALMPLIEQETANADEAVRQITDGAVSGPKSNQALLDWANSIGFKTDSLARGVVGDLLKYYPERLPPKLKAVLLERQKAYKASVAKIPAMIHCTEEDGRARNQFQYHKPTTGRWASRLIQVQNLVRFPKFWSVEQAEDVFGVARRFPRDPERQARYLRMSYGEPLDVISWSLRALLKAGPGNELLSADFSNIEGRMLAWLAREDWKLDAFRDYDAGTGPDLYCVAYGRSFGVAPEDVDDDQRQLGKVQELASGYQGGLGAYKNMAAIYDVLILPSLEDAPANAKQVITEAQAEDLKTAWRDKHPATVSLWYDTQRAAINAVENPGMIIEVRTGRYAFRYVDDYLFCRLPSGRVLSYPAPRIAENQFGKPELSIMGEHPITKQWSRVKTYGGMLVQNVTQAASADVLIDAMFRLEAQGFPVVLHVHDEIVSETCKGARSLAEFEALMNVVPEWAQGLPLAAKGWQGERYRK